MKHLLVWFWHGENVAPRLGLALVGALGVLMQVESPPANSWAWVRLVASLLMAGVAGLASRQQNGRTPEA